MNVTGDPTPWWLGPAHANADVIRGGGESMMTDFVKQLGDITDGRAASARDFVAVLESRDGADLGGWTARRNGAAQRHFFRER